MKNQNRALKQGKSAPRSRQTKNVRPVSLSRVDTNCIDFMSRMFTPVFLKRMRKQIEEHERKTNTRHVVLSLPETLEARVEICAMWLGKRLETVCMESIAALADAVCGDIASAARGAQFVGLTLTAKQTRQSKRLFRVLQALETGKGAA